MKKYLFILPVILMTLLLGASPAYATFKLPKVAICHNIDHNPHTIIVDVAAVPAHLKHGDSLGYCINPNPFPSSSPSFSPSPSASASASPSATPSASPSPDVTPTPEVRLNNGPQSGENVGHPECSDLAPTQKMANFHVYRNGDDAILKWFPTEGDKANIFYKQNNSPIWQYSLTDIANDGYEMIHGLGSLDITFAGQQARGCAGGPLTPEVIDGPSTHWVLFR